jgi:hypothetical protein
MTKPGVSPRSTPRCTVVAFVKAFLFVLALAVAGLPQPGRAVDDPDDDYLRIFYLIQNADLLRNNGQPDAARIKYQQADNALQDFKRYNPSVHSALIAYRLSYVEGRLKALPPPAAPTKPPVAAPIKAAPVTMQQMKLLEPGSEPRQSLRLHFAAGDKQSIALSLKMNMAMQSPDMPIPPMKMPAIIMPMDLTIQNVAPDGTATYQLVAGDVTVASEPDSMPQIVDMMKASLSAVKGLTTIGTITSRAENRIVEVRMLEKADAQLTQTLQQLKDSLANVSTPLPDEPVGPGAKWQVHLPIKTQGMTVDQTMTYELVSVEGEHVTIRVALGQSAAAQKIENAAMPGISVDLTRMSGSGTGQIVLDLGRVMPVQANIESTVEMAMSIPVGGQKHDMSMNSDVTMKIDSK